MLCLLQRKLGPWRGLNVRRASQVLDAVPRDVVEPLEVHDFFVHAKSLLTSKQVLLITSRGSCGGLIGVLGEGPVSAAALMSLSRWRPTDSTAS